MQKIKEFIIGLLVVVILVGGLGVVGGIETHYTRDVTVISIEDTKVVTEDKSNNVWVFEGTGYKEGQQLKLKMFTNGTDNVFDDEIQDVKVVE